MRWWAWSKRREERRAKKERKKLLKEEMINRGVRSKEKFLFLPKCLPDSTYRRDKQWRWWEYACIEQKLVPRKLPLPPSWKKWKDVGWW